MMQNDNQPFNQSQDSPLMVSECDSIIHRVNLIRRHKSMARRVYLSTTTTTTTPSTNAERCPSTVFSPSHEPRRVNNPRSTLEPRIYSRIRKSNYWCEIRKRGINNKWWGANINVMWLASIKFNCYLFGARFTCSMLAIMCHVCIYLIWDVAMPCHAVILCNVRLNATNISAVPPLSLRAPAACNIRVRCSNIIFNLTSHITH